MLSDMTPHGSGSIKDWEFTPNLTPRGYEIKKDELYVLSGDTIIKTYHLLLTQRLAALQTVARLQPTSLAEVDEYLSIAKHINLILYHILHSVPLMNIMQMQEENRISEEEKKTPSKKTEKRQQGLTLKEMLKKFHLTDGGTKDELPPPEPPTTDK